MLVNTAMIKSKVRIGLERRALLEQRLASIERDKRNILFELNKLPVPSDIKIWDMPGFTEMSTRSQRALLHGKLPHYNESFWERGEKARDVLNFILTYGVDEIKKIPYCGRKTVIEVRQFITTLGFSCN